MKHKEQARFRSTLKGIGLMAGSALFLKSGAGGMIGRYVREKFSETAVQRAAQFAKEFSFHTLLHGRTEEIARLTSIMSHRLPRTEQIAVDLDIVKYVKNVAKQLGTARTLPSHVGLSELSRAGLRGNLTVDDVRQVTDFIGNKIGSLPSDLAISPEQFKFLEDMAKGLMPSQKGIESVRREVASQTSRLLPTSKVDVWSKLFEPTAHRRLSLADISPGGPHENLLSSITGELTTTSEREFFEQLLSQVDNYGKRIAESISVDAGLFVNEASEILSVKARKNFFNILLAKAADVPIVPLIGYNPLQTFRSSIAPFYGPETMFQVFSGQAIPGFKGHGMFYNIGNRLYSLTGEGTNQFVSYVRPMKTTEGVGRLLSPAVGFGFRPRSFREYATSFLRKGEPAAMNLYPPSVAKLFKNKPDLHPDTVFGPGRIDERAFSTQVDKFLLRRSKFDGIPYAAHDMVISSAPSGRSWKVGQLLANEQSLAEAFREMQPGLKFPEDRLVSRATPEFIGLGPILDPGHTSVGKLISGNDIAILRMLRAQGKQTEQEMRALGVDEPLRAWLEMDFGRSTIETGRLRRFLKEQLIKYEPVFKGKFFDKPNVQYAGPDEPFERVMYPMLSKSAAAIRRTVDSSIGVAAADAMKKGSFMEAEAIMARGGSQGSAIMEVMSGLVSLNKEISSQEALAGIADAAQGAAIDMAGLMTDRYTTASMMWHQIFMPISQYGSTVPLIGNIFRERMANPKQQLVAIAAATMAVDSAFSFASFVDYIQRKTGRDGIHDTVVDAWVNMNLGLASMQGRREETEQYYLEGENVIRKGRFWTLSNTPYLGEAAIASVPNVYRKKEARAEFLKQYYGEEEGDYWSWYLNPVKRFVTDRYHKERLHMRDMPYEVSSPPFDPNTPHGALGNLFLGWFIKPQMRYQKAVGAPGPGGGGDTAGGVQVVPGGSIGSGIPLTNVAGIPVAMAGYGSTGEFSSLGHPGKGTLLSRDLLVGLNETAANLDAAPIIAPGIKEGISEVFHSFTEIAGLRGWALQKFIGTDQLFSSRTETPGDYFSAGFALKDMQMGGLPYEEFSEIPRRLWAPPRRGNVVNRIRNDMPTWMPGPDYFINFRSGNPYSKVVQGIWRLPGRSYEATHGGLGEIVRHAGPSILGKTEAEIISYLTNTEQRLPQYQEEILEAGTLLHRSIELELESKGVLIGSEVEIKDPATGMVGYIDAIIEGSTGPAIVEIKTAGKNTMEAARAGAAKDAHISQVNFYLYSAKMNEGYLLYVNRSDPSDRMLIPVQYDRNRLIRDLDKLGNAQQQLASMMEEGIVSPYETYKPITRANILADIAPWSAEYEIELKRAKSEAHTDEDKKKVMEIQEKARHMKKRNYFQERKFKYPLIESPARILEQVGPLMFKVQAGDDVQVIRLAGLQKPVEGRDDIARERLMDLLMNTELTMRWVPGQDSGVFYVHGLSVSQAMIGEAMYEEIEEPATAADYEAIHGKKIGYLESAWESIIHADTPITNKFGRMTALEHYSRRQLYGDQYLGWNLIKHIKATFTALTSKDPLPSMAGGAAIGVVLNLSKGHKRWVTGGTYGAVIGLATSMMRMALHPSSIMGTYVPKDEKNMREIEEWFDRIKFLKYKILFDRAADLSQEMLGINVRKLADLASSSNKIANLPPELIMMDPQSASAYDQASRMLELLDSGELSGLPDLVQKALYYKHQYESTVAALDTESSVAQIMRALPKRMRGYIPAWIDAPVQEQEEILQKIPSDTRRALLLHWNRAQPRISMTDYFQAHWLPPPDHEIWGPDTSLDDYKINVAHDAAIDAHEMSLWPTGAEGELEYIPSLSTRTPDVRSRLMGMFLANGVTDFDIKIIESNTYNSRVDMNFNIKEDRTDYYAENILREGYL